MEFWGILLASLFGLALIAVIILVVIYFLNKLKVKISIKLDKFEFSEGDSVKGTILLKIKKPVFLKSVRVGLIGYSERRSVGLTRYSSEEREIYDSIRPVVTNKSYSPGEYEIPFSFKIPKNVTDDIFNKGVGKVLGSIGRTMGILGYVEWYVYADVDVPGINPSTKVKISIVEKGSVPKGAIS